MSSADSTLDKRTTNCKSDFASSFTTTATALNAAGEYPTLTIGLQTGQEILATRVQTILTNGFKAKSATDVLANPSSFYNRELFF